jgi:hypothetical protein
MVIHIVILCALFGSKLNQSLKHWTKPTTAPLAVGTLADMTRSRRDLVAENALLRQQLIALRRQVKRPDLTNSDRIQLVLLARFTRYWQYALHIVQPDTLLRWHRNLFHLYWRRKSRKGKRKPRVPQETIDLIQQMCSENRLWGAERIRANCSSWASKSANGRSSDTCRSDAADLVRPGPPPSRITPASSGPAISRSSTICCSGRYTFSSSSD